MKRIPLTLDENFKMLFALVDDEDYTRVYAYGTWFINYSITGRISSVVHRPSGGKPIAMHHLILGKPLKGFVVDHINHDPLDNRRENLRIVTTVINTRNRANYKNNIWAHRNHYRVGMSFRTKEHAEKAVAALLALRKEFYGDVE